MVVTVLISNTDDHLRNHAFLFSGGNGWRLSPAYDLNPNPLAGGTAYLQMAIDLDNTEASTELVLSVHKEFQLSLREAKTILADIRAVVQDWRDTAKSFNIGERECERMATAFMRAGKQ